MSIFKSYVFLQNLEGVAQKLSMPRPFQFWTCKGCGSPNFCARPSKFLSDIHLLQINKWYFYQFSVSLLGNQILEKNWKFVMTNGPLMVNVAKSHSYLPSGGHMSWQFFSFSLIFDFLIKIQKIDKNMICLPIKDPCLTKIWKVWLKKPVGPPSWRPCSKQVESR